MNKKSLNPFAVLGPGIAVAATGVGAGDMIAAAVSGATYGTIILWAAVFGALIKFTLNEGIARWQLATGETLLEGWAVRLGRWVSVSFMVYLVLWTFVVAGALIAACGLAAHALFPQLPVTIWGILHSLVAVILVYAGRYTFFEIMMKLFVGMMFIVMIACAVQVAPDWRTILPSLVIPRVPAGAGKYILGVIGGVGGSVTLLNYSYWIRERQWEGKAYRKHTLLDLDAAYILTGIFGAAVMIIAGGVNPEIITGKEMALAVASRLETLIGLTGKWTFLLGFWGAVFSSMLGVWQGVPYMFTDFMLIRRQNKETSKPAAVSVNSIYYRGYLLYIALPPIALLYVAKPVWIVVIYSIAGAFFMPFLALTLLYMNNRREWVAELKNRWYINLLLVISLAVFVYLLTAEILTYLAH